MTRFVQPEKIEIDASERAVNEKSQYCFFVCTTFDSFLNDLATLTQNGVGPEQGFSIEDSSATWTDFIGEVKNMEFVKSYVFIQTKLLFDPPLSSAVMEMYNKKADEYLWRIQDVVSENQEENQNGE